MTCTIIYILDIVNCMIVLYIVFDLWGPQVRLVSPNWVNKGYYYYYYYYIRPSYAIIVN
jgi:hypothetical protein